jgi:hypothetical protein
LTLIAWVGRENPSGIEAQLPELVRSEAFFLRLTRSGLNETRSQSIGEVAVRREYRLPWDTLVRMLGEEELIRRFGAIADQAPKDERDRRAVETAQRYAGVCVAKIAGRSRRNRTGLLVQQMRKGSASPPN